MDEIKESVTKLLIAIPKQNFGVSYFVIDMKYLDTYQTLYVHRDEYECI